MRKVGVKPKLHRSLNRPDALKPNQRDATQNSEYLNRLSTEIIVVILKEIHHKQNWGKDLSFYYPRLLHFPDAIFNFVPMES